MTETPDEQRRRLGHLVEMHRTDAGWSKEEAARIARISSITWKRVEDGLQVQDVKLAAVMRALNITVGDLAEVGIELLGRPPIRTATPETVSASRDALADSRFRRPEGIGDDEWERYLDMAAGYLAALLDQAETER